MAPVHSRKRKLEDSSASRPPHRLDKSRKQKHYSSPSTSPSTSEAEFNPISLEESDDDTSPPVKAKTSRKPKLASSPELLATDSSASDSEASLAASSQESKSSGHNTPQNRKTHKRNDPSAFSTSIQAILTSKLPVSKRRDPLLARSHDAQAVNDSIQNSKLETKAKSKLRHERKKELEIGRIRDVLAGDESNEKVEGVGGKWDLEKERQLRKTAQRGVVKLFNAVRAAQVKGEEARKEGGTGKRRDERVGEMSKKGFLELVASGGKVGGG